MKTFEQWRGEQDPSQLRAETAWQTVERAWKDSAANAPVIEVSKKLLLQWEAYQKTTGSHEEAYYKLAKYAYPRWLELQKAIGSTNG